MNRSDIPHICDWVRDEAYRYRRGDLLGAEVKRVDEHLEDCAGCCDYYERLGILLEAAHRWEPEEEASSDSDELFAGIAARVEQADTAAGSEFAPADEVGDVDDFDDYANKTGRGRWIHVAAGLAAGILLTLGAFFVVEQVQNPVAEQATEFAVDDNVAEDEPSAADDEPSGGSQDEFATLVRQKQTSDEVSIFASEAASWSLSGDDEMVLELERGTLLVEFLPREGSTLKVQTPDFEAQVVGTVFYVTAEPDNSGAGVLVGEIEVSRDGSGKTNLTAGLELDGAFEPREMAPRRASALSNYIDADEHREKLARLRTAPYEAAPAPTEKRRSPATDEPAPERNRNRAEDKPHLAPELERLRSRAERATRQGHYQAAVRHYRTLLARLQPTHPTAASVHLDLAQIYLHRLNSPGSAAPHLRTFVDRWPTDVAAPSARRQLCEISRTTGLEEPGCEVQP